MEWADASFNMQYVASVNMQHVASFKMQHVNETKITNIKIQNQNSKLKIRVTSTIFDVIF